ncbi:MAG: rubredoxin [Mycoplasmataceae bacterium]|jgi:rubredoxin|nr:rubredoxin [Mycoplasmataceae bacterium]
MSRYICSVCQYIYDEEHGDNSNHIKAGTAWKDVPEDYTCPACGASKSRFNPE